MSEIPTGYIDLVNSKNKQALIFEDSICPNCGEQLYILIKRIRDEVHHIRFECKQCGFICPIYHDLENDIIRPVYDESLKKFKDEFYNKKN